MESDPSHKSDPPAVSSSSSMKALQFSVQLYIKETCSYYALYRICRYISRSYSTNSSPPFRGVRLIYRMRRFSWTISRSNLIPRCSLVPTRGRVRVGTSKCLGMRDISRRGYIWSTWNIAAFHCEASKES